MGHLTTSAFMNRTNQWRTTNKISAEPSMHHELDATGSLQAPIELDAGPLRTGRNQEAQKQVLTSLDHAGYKLIGGRKPKPVEKHGTNREESTGVTVPQGGIGGWI